MKCTVCKQPAVIDLRRHNANFCREHFLRLCRDQTAKAIKDFTMLAPGDRVLVAVSGGKDSLALWDILLELGYAADGLYVGLGIGDYSDESGDYARSFARERNLELIEIDLRAEHGYDIPTAAVVTKRAPCSVCGLSKRHLFDRAALDGGYDAVATGHNLDDEAAVLFGNVLHWHTEYLGRQLPVLPARDGFPKKIKPLVRLGEREMAAYCVLRGIDYIVEECPMAVGNRHLGYKNALDSIEADSPGAKFAFYSGFLAKAVSRFADDTGADELGTCERCGGPSSAPVCSFCRVVERTAGAEPVSFVPGPRRRVLRQPQSSKQPQAKSQQPQQSTEGSDA
jgi:uncharacterized protein (TIGR00269 family)